MFLAASSASFLFFLILASLSLNFFPSLLSYFLAAVFCYLMRFSASFLIISFMTVWLGLGQFEGAFGFFFFDLPNTLYI